MGDGDDTILHLVVQTFFDDLFFRERCLKHELVSIVGVDSLNYSRFILKYGLRLDGNEVGILTVDNKVVLNIPGHCKI